MNFIDIFQETKTIFWVVLMFSGSIFIHELGHFLAARARGLRVERFCIGFGPRLITWKKNEVEYSIALLPLGGYVSIPQLADLELVEGEYKRKDLPEVPYGDRLLVLGMGAIFNLLFAFFLATLVWWLGQPSTLEDGPAYIGYVPAQFVLEDQPLMPNPAYEAGLAAGDLILSIDGQKVHRFKDIDSMIALGHGRNPSGQPQATIEINRDGQTHTLQVQPALIAHPSSPEDYIRAIALAPAHQLQISTVMPGSPAARAGLQTQDIIQQLNGKPIYSLAALVDTLQKHPNAPVLLDILRGEQPQVYTLYPQNVAYTQYSLKMTAIEDPQAQLILIPSLDEAHQGKLIQPHTSIPSLSVFKIQEGQQGNRFSELQIGDQIWGVSPTIPLISLINFQDTFNAMNAPITLWVKPLEKEPFVWSSPSEWVATLEKPQTHALLGFICSPEASLSHPSPLRQVIQAAQMVFQVLNSLLNPSSDIHLNHLMGPPGIFRAMHSISTVDFRLLLAFSVLLNVNLAILNLMPIPVLDGGHILFATINRLRRKPLPASLMLGIQKIFMLALFGFMLYVSFFDIRRIQSDYSLKAQWQLKQSYYIEPQFE